MRAPAAPGGGQRGDAAAPDPSADFGAGPGAGPVEGPGAERTTDPDRPQAPPRPVFVARSTYRHRRMIDAAALLPILGALVFALPLIWLGADTGTGTDASMAEATLPRTSHVMIYLFIVWALLVVLSARITHHLAHSPGAPATPAAPGDDAAAEDAAAPKPQRRG